jgi:hypothetical protein
VPADRVILWARQRYAADRAAENHGECGSEAAAGDAEAWPRVEKRELCSRTPQTAA